MRQQAMEVPIAAEERAEENYGVSSRNGSFLLHKAAKTQEYGVSIKPSLVSLWCFDLMRWANDRSNPLQWTVLS